MYVQVYRKYFILYLCSEMKEQNYTKQPTAKQTKN